MTSGGFLESEGSHNNSELSSRSHCRFNARTVVLHLLCWGPNLPLLLIVSLTLSFCFLLFSKGPHRSFPLNFALRMIYPHNPQSRQLTRNIIALRPHASDPRFPLLPSRGYFRHYALCSPSGFCLYDRALRVFPHVCFARLSRVNNLFPVVNPGPLLFPSCLIVMWPLCITGSRRKTLERLKRGNLRVRPPLSLPKVNFMDRAQV